MNQKTKDLLLQGEPSLGSIYGQEEIDTINKSVRDSMDPSIGFYAAKDTEVFENEFKKISDTRHAIAFNGAGGALDLLLRSLNLQPEDEVISCSLNFVGTHLSVLGFGAKLVLSEPDSDTINMDPEDLKNRLTKNTKAILVTHMNGLAADMDEINKVVNESPLYGDNKPKVICDAARSIGTTYKGKHLGGEGWATFFSLQSKKVITTLGEGGVVTTNDDQLAETLRRFRSFGKFKSWGSNYKMTKVQASVGLVQLTKLSKFVILRRELADQRTLAISQYPEIKIQKDTAYSQSSYYLYTLILPHNEKGEKRDLLMKVLKDEYGIGSVVGNPPTHNLNELIKEKTANQILPRAEDMGERILCLCLHPALDTQTNTYIINSFIDAYRKIFVGQK